MTQELHAKPPTEAERVGQSGIYPASGPWPVSDAPLREQGELGHPERLRLGSGVPRQNRALEAALLGFGRAAFGGYFLYNGVNHFLNRQMLAQYAGSKQVPAPDAAVLGSGALLLLGGLSLITGIRPKVGSALIAAFLLGVTPKMHDFWAVEDEQQRMQELINFSKNVALLGATGFAAAVPEPWPGRIAV